MVVPPKYTIIPEMLELISRIEAQKLSISSLSLPKIVKEKIQRVSLLKSSLFSARIEGNPLEFSDLEIEADEKKKREVFNIVEAVNFLDSHMEKEAVTKDHLLELHKRVMKNIAPDAGYFRKEISAIFNQAGVAIYIPPPPSEISDLLDKLLLFINSEKEKFPLITAFIGHLVFEKIHPFLDGNGRVGRLLIGLILRRKEWDFAFTIPFEEYLDAHKDKYYFHLDNGLQNTNEYLLFILNAFWEQIEQIQKQIKEELAKQEEPFLPPRQEEIYHIIKDHLVVSFDMIRRRFLQVPSRTLRYDLKKLVDQGLIEKGGETKGSYYRVKNKREDH